MSDDAESPGVTSAAHSQQTVAHCPVVGLGASAGGIDAFRTFFDHAAADAGIAYVVVLHLSPDARSSLAELLGRHTEMPVVQVSGRTALEPDKVYVMQPATVLTLEDGELVPHGLGDAQNGRRTPIDRLFFSLAEERGERAACIILSGTGSDGTLGLRAVKENGGLSLVQTPETAGHTGMMSSAIATGLVDRVLDVADMPAVIARYFRGQEEDRRIASADGTRPDVVEQLPQITRLLMERTREDFSNYKQGTLVRRIQRRMHATGALTPNDYLVRLNDDAGEAEQLLKDLLIGVTEFFRDANAFAALRDKAIPKLFDSHAADAPVRVWIPGCATGEEAYSVAILLLEHARTLEHAPDIMVFASDIDTEALDVARRGTYPASALENVPDDLVLRYFQHHDEFYTVRDPLRQQVLFTTHNVLRDPPFSRLGLISCRNMLIYLQPEIQGRLLQTFHYALREGGFLLLGTAETAGREAKRFTPVDRTLRLYGRNDDLERSIPDLPLIAQPFEHRTAASRQSGQQLPSSQQNSAAERLVLDRYAPAWVVVDEDMKVRTFSTQTGKFLGVPAGAPTNNVLEFAKGELRSSLRTALHKAFRTGERVCHRDLAVDVDGARQQFDLTVEPFVDDRKQLCLVVFAESGPMVDALAERGRRPDDVARRERYEGNAADEAERDHELREARERLRTTREELETANEELKASNEELASINEELQSSNEELETSKEELQSSNEELQTVNTELSERVDELARANSDLHNFVMNTNVAILVVDGDLRIRHFTPPVADIFHVLESDKGRPLDHITHRLDDGRILEDARGVMRDLQRVEREVPLKAGDTFFLVRILPYRTLEDRIDGAVLTFTDISRLKEDEHRLEESERHQRLLLRELQHRVKNILANVRGLARQTLPESGNLQEFYEAFEGRLEALGRAQGLLQFGAGARIALADLVLEELLAHTAQPDDKIDVDGPDVLLEPRAAQTLGLTLHELATNAVKYGALSDDDAQLSVRWRVEERGDEPHLILQWQESGLHLGPDAGKSGFGRRLVEQAAPYELGGTCRLEFPPDGCRCVMEIPFDDRVTLAGNSEMDEEDGG